MEDKAREKFIMEDPPLDPVRRREIDELLALLETFGEGPHPIILIYGLSGTGKTTIAAMLCQELRKTGHPLVRDGIDWITLGDKNNTQLAEVLQEKIRPDSGNPPTLPASLEAVRQEYLNEALAERKMVLVIDDVRDPEQMRLFISNRNKNLLRIFIGQRESLPDTENVRKFHIAGMLPEESVALLSQGFEFQEKDMESLRQLAADAGNYPLALTLINRGMRREKGVGVSDPRLIGIARTYLAQSGLPASDTLVADKQTVGIYIEKNLKYLDPVKQDFYRRLVLFPNPERIDRSIVERYITKFSGGKITRPADFIADLADLSLIGEPDGLYLSLNEVIYNHLTSKRDKIAQYHLEFLKAFDCDHWQGWGEPEKYLWENVIFHYVTARHTAKAIALLTDINFVAHKITFTEAHSIETDLLLVKRNCSSKAKEKIDVLAKRFSNCNHLLHACGTNLPQLTSALQSRVFCDDDTGSLPPFIRAHNTLPDLPAPELIRTFRGHTGRVYGCDIDIDAELIVTASEDMTVKLWRVEDGKVLRSLEGHGNRVFAAKISADRRYIISGSVDRAVMIWDLSTGLAHPPLKGHEGPVWCCAITGDNKTIISASDDNTVKVWDREKHECIQTLDGHKGPVTGCCFFNDGEYIVSAGHDKSLMIWKKSDRFELIEVLEGHSAAVWSCAVSDTGRIISSSVDWKVRIWDIYRKEEDFELDGHKGPVWGCAISKDGRLGFTVSEDLQVKVWDIETRKILRTLVGHSRYLWGVAYSSEKQRLVTCSLDTTAKLWDIKKITA